MPVRRLRTRPEGDRAPHTSKVRRIKTVADVYYDGVDRVSRDLEILQHEVFDELISRLQAARIPLSDNLRTLLDFICPHDHAQVWQKLLHKPMTVTTEELLAIFELELSTESTPMPTPGDQIYYVRTIPLTVENLRRIIGKWQAEKRHADECIAWSRAIRFIADRDEIIYVRYIGTSNTVSAWSRHTTDGTRRHGGLYGHFREAMEEICPDSITSCTTHEFSKAAAEGFNDVDGNSFYLDLAHTDIREQALIALFGQTVLLNRQAGGVGVSYQPDEQDVDHFKRLNTHIFSRLLLADSYAEPSEEIRALVADWMHEVCVLGKSHPKELGTDKVPVTDNMQNAWTEQAIPCTFHGKVLALIIGDFCPTNAMYNPAPYWSQPNRSVKYLKDTFARLHAYEDGKTRMDTASVSSITDKAVFPWINYQYTPKREEFRHDSADLMRKYLAVIQPLVVLSFERRTSGVLRADFAGVWSKYDFHPDVGIPEIHYYTHRGEIFGAGTRLKLAEVPVEDEDCYIQFPSIHPGADKYDHGSPAQRRVFEMTLWQFALLLDCALDALDACALQNDVIISRSYVCQAILSSFQKRWHESGNAREFDAAKTSLAEWYQAKPGRYSSDPKRSWKPNVNGNSVAVNQSGIVTIYWTNPKGENIKATIAGGRGTDVSPPKGAKEPESIRTIHFMPTGIDIRDSAGVSRTYRRFKRTTTNPTFPGDVLRAKMDENGVAEMIKLWEYETGLEFDAAFPEDSPITGSACQACAANRYTCGNDRPCERCVRLGLECKPQTLKKRSFDELT